MSMVTYANTSQQDKEGTQIIVGHVVEYARSHYNMHSATSRCVVVEGNWRGEDGFWLFGQRCFHPQCRMEGETEFTWNKLTPEMARECKVLGFVHEVNRTLDYDCGYDLETFEIGSRL